MAHTVSFCLDAFAAKVIVGFWSTSWPLKAVLLCGSCPACQLKRTHSRPFPCFKKFLRKVTEDSRRSRVTYTMSGARSSYTHTSLYTVQFLWNCEHDVCKCDSEICDRFAVFTRRSPAVRLGKIGCYWLCRVRVFGQLRCHFQNARIYIR